jgi:amino acid transporter
VTKDTQAEAPVSEADLASQDLRAGKALPQALKDARDLEKMGYVQELLRDMGGFGSFAMSFSVISILTGGTQLFGYGLQHGGPFQISVGWAVVAFFTMTVALAMAELASTYPTAGALYHWASFLGGRTLGWFTACFNTVGQFALLAGIDYGLAVFILGLTGWPNTPIVLSSVYLALLLSHAFLNHRGIHLVTMLNNLSAWYHIVVVFLLLGALAHAGFTQPVGFLLRFNTTDGFKPGYSFLVGLLLAQWTLTGYDASAHVTEETLNPRKNAPWGIFIAVLISAGFGFLMLSAITLSIPDLAQATGFGDDAFTKIVLLRLGAVGGTAVVALVGGAMWLCGLATMTSASRMVYAFARDGGLPLARFWSKVSTKHRTPAHAIWGLAGASLLLFFLVKDVSNATSIATIALYLSYGLPILARLIYRAKRRAEAPGPWTLGRFSTPVAVVAVSWVTFICVVFVLPPNQDAGKYIAACTGALVLLWLLYVRKHFEGPKFHP